MEKYNELDAYVEALKENKIKKVFIEAQGDKEGKYFMLTCTAKNGNELMAYQEVSTATDFPKRHEDVAKALVGIKIIAGATQ